MKYVCVKYYILFKKMILIILSSGNSKLSPMLKYIVFVGILLKLR